MEIIFGFLDLPKGSNVIVPAHTMLATASAAKTAEKFNPILLMLIMIVIWLRLKRSKKCDLKNVSCLDDYSTKWNNCRYESYG